MRCERSSNPVLALRFATAAMVAVCVAATTARAQQQTSPIVPPQLPSDVSPAPASRYSSEEIVDAGHHFFGGISKGVALIVEKAANQWGQPNGYILGEEAGGAFIGGLRYGDGMLYTKDAGDLRVFWEGPSFGFDFGADSARTMMLVYSLPQSGAIFNRLGGVYGPVRFCYGLRLAS